MEAEGDLKAELQSAQNKIRELRNLLHKTNILLTNKEEESERCSQLLMVSLKTLNETRKKLLVSEGNLIINSENCFEIKRLFEMNVAPEVRCIWVAELEKRYSKMMVKQALLMSCINLDRNEAEINPKTMIYPGYLSKYVKSMCIEIELEAEMYNIILNKPENVNLESFD